MKTIKKYKIDLGDERAQMLNILIHMSYIDASVLGLPKLFADIRSDIVNTVHLKDGQVYSNSENLLIYMNMKEGMKNLNKFFNTFKNDYYRTMILTGRIHNYWENHTVFRDINNNCTWTLEYFIKIVQKYGIYDGK